MTVRRGISKRSHEKIGDVNSLYAWLDLREAGSGKKGKMERGLGTEGIHFFAPATSQVAQARLEI